MNKVYILLSMYIQHLKTSVKAQCISFIICCRGSIITKVKILCWRDQVRSGKRDTSHSLVLNVKLPSFSKTG